MDTRFEVFHLVRPRLHKFLFNLIREVSPPCPDYDQNDSYDKPCGCFAALEDPITLKHWFSNRSFWNTFLTTNRPVYMLPAPFDSYQSFSCPAQSFLSLCSLICKTRFICLYLGWSNRLTQESKQYNHLFTNVAQQNLPNDGGGGEFPTSKQFEATGTSLPPPLGDLLS